MSRFVPPPMQLSGNWHVAERLQPQKKFGGRIETRTVTTTINIVELKYIDWPGATQLVKLERYAIEKRKVRQTPNYGITSRPWEQANATFLLQHL